jgi:predicted ribosome quality control (RQC) complex YloA/Tae2 family protein
VGRNHRQNDWISLRQARRGDLWFHAQECPGSHVVLKASEAPADAEDLTTAADLAAHFSRARGNRRVPVVMVLTETLQRIPGEPPGTVRHGPAEVLWGEPDRVAPLLASLGSPPPAEAGPEADGAGLGAAHGSDGRPGAAQFDP